MFEKDWKDELNDSDVVKISVLKLKSWSEQAANIRAVLSLINCVNDREQLMLYITEALRSQSFAAFELEEDINDLLREIKEAK